MMPISLSCKEQVCRGVLVAGGCNAPNALLIPFRLEMAHLRLDEAML